MLVAAMARFDGPKAYRRNRLLGHRSEWRRSSQARRDKGGSKAQRDPLDGLA